MTSDALTTLVTFLLQTPSAVFSVEVLGSWDNFSKPYSLKQDRRTGEGHWRGCHVFDNITCDGDPSAVAASRHGALLMGGRYWYYYRLNGETEYHDPAEPSTSSCPLLPGQPVNVLDVPVQQQQTMDGMESSDLTDSAIFTLNPKDKYLTPGVRRAATTSAVEQGKLRLPKGFKTPQSRSANNSGRPQSPQKAQLPPGEPLVFDRQPSVRSVFNLMRKTRSAGSGLRRSGSWHRNLFSRAGSSRKALVTEDVPVVPKIPADMIVLSKPSNACPTSLPPRSSPSNVEKISMVSLREGFDGNGPSPGHGYPFLDRGLEIWPTKRDSVQCLPETVQPLVAENRIDVVTAIDGPNDHNEYVQQIFMTDLPRKGFLETTNADDKFSADDSNPYMSEAQDEFVFPASLSNQPLRSEDLNLRNSCNSDLACSYSESQLSSYATENNFSPGPASTAPCSGKVSPIHLSQPETPVLSGFVDDDEDDALSWEQGMTDKLGLLSIRPPSRAPPPPPPPPPMSHQLPAFSQQSSPVDNFRPFQSTMSGFQGYSLPERENGSSLTLREPQSATVSHHSDRSLHQQTNKQEFVQSWNDGSEHHMSALADLVCDLGYLGKLII